MPEGNGTEPTDERIRVRRLGERGRYDRETVDAILDEALVCHVGFVEGGQPPSPSPPPAGRRSPRRTKGNSGPRVFYDCRWPACPRRCAWDRRRTTNRTWT